MIDDGSCYRPKTMTYTEAMARIVRQFKCSRKEAFKLMEIFTKRNFFKLEDNV